MRPFSAVNIEHNSKHIWNEPEETYHGFEDDEELKDVHIDEVSEGPNFDDFD